MQLKMLYRWQISIYRNTQHNLFLEHCKLKQWNTMEHLLEWLKSKKWTKPELLYWATSIAEEMELFIAKFLS